MELAESVSESNQNGRYRLLKVAFVLSFVVTQTPGTLVAGSKTEGKVIAPISFKLVGRVVKEEMTSHAGMTDEQSGRIVYQQSPALWSEYVGKYKEKYAIDPVAWYPRFSEVERAEFCGLSVLAIAFFFEILRRAFYYVVFGRVFPPKKRRKRRSRASITAPGQ